MKKALLISAVFVLGFVLAGNAQDATLIIDEDFQDWPATEGIVSDPPSECESVPLVTGPDVYDIEYVTGGSGEVTLIKYAISPECNTKYVNRGDTPNNAIDVTTGFIQLTKTVEEGDTIGQMYLPELSNVTNIEFGYSCTGADRGIRLYTSTDGGETWEGPWTEEGPGVGEIIRSNVQQGEMVELTINRDNVILKFTSGIDDEDVSQNSRIHNIKIWGVPGFRETGIDEAKRQEVNAWYAPEIGLVIEGEVSYVGIFDLTGRMVKESYVFGNQTIDISGLSGGIYIMKALDSEQEVVTKKFMKD
jgi:hypothetical protein